jgi:hypothetical protein
MEQHPHAENRTAGKKSGKKRQMRAWYKAGGAAMQILR